MKPKRSTRRNFLKTAGGACAVAAVGAGALSTVGCQGRPSKTSADGTVTLDFLSYAGEGYLQIYTKYLIPGFEKEHPKIKIRLTTNLGDANYDTKLLTLIAGGIAPDLFHVTQQNFPSYAAKDILLPLNEIIDKDSTFDLKDYYPRVMNEMRYNGEMLGLPSDFSPVAMLYNKDMFDRAGLEMPKPDWTVDEFLAICKKLRKRPDEYAVSNSTDYNRWPAWIWINGGEIFSADGTRCLMDHPEAIEGLKFFVNLSLKHDVAPTPGLGLGLSQGLSDAELYMAQRLAMIPNARYVYKRFIPEESMKDPSKDPLKFDWDVVPLPRGKRQATTFIWGGNCIVKNTRYPKESWAFLKYMSDDRGAALTAQAGNALPPHRATAERAVANPIHPRTPQHDAIYLSAIDYARQAPFPAQFAAFNASSITIKDAFLGLIPVDQACRRFTKDVNEIISGKVF